LDAPIMAGHGRLQSELHFHDQQARQRALDLSHHPHGYFFADETYLDHETWIRPAFMQLGDVTGLQVLDYGCGHGMAAVTLARRGARVTAIDLSRAYLDEARTRARACDAAVHFVRADGEHLPFADTSFDRIWGNAILHHLELTTATQEIRRVLRPDGLALFCEPLGGNPLLNWARTRLPYQGKQRTPDERPLSPQDFNLIRKVFPRMQVRGYQFLSMVRRIVRIRRLVAGLDWCDRALLARFPALERYCRYAVLTLRP
jgi:ubiquinone/menaquinone biosynthesis C-methylase UbiE